jgi:hypothetical protein
MKRSCPECKAEMRPVKLLDATHIGGGRAGSTHVDFSYAALESKPSSWTKTVPREGIIMAMLCPDCGRTLLYAKPDA